MAYDGAGRAYPDFVRDIAADVADLHSVSINNIMSRSRKRAYVYARRDLIKRLLQADKYSLTQIGRWLGVHHATIIYHKRELERSDA